MSFFSVIREKSSGDFEVEECHINLWSLSSIFSRRSFVCDIGLLIKAKDAQTVNKIQLVLPFGSYNNSREDSIIDLSPLVLKFTTAQLLFGNVDSVDEAKSIISYESSNQIRRELNVVGVNENQCERINILSGNNYSFWSITLSSDIPPNVDSYLRIRFRVRDVNPVWKWKRSKTGSLVDLRVADVRGSVVNKNWSNFHDRIIPIQKLNLFVIASSLLQPKTISPPCYYMRLFEGKEWLPYLKRKIDLFSKENLIIYQWRNINALPINPSRPFHAFLDLTQEVKTINLKNLAFLLLLTILILITLKLLTVAYPEYLSSEKVIISLQKIWLCIIEIKSWIAFGVILTLGLFGLRYILDYFISKEKFEPVLGSIMDCFYKVERWFYSVRDKV